MQNFNLEQDAVSWVFRPLIVCVHCVCAFACLHVCCITLFFFYMDYIYRSITRDIRCLRPYHTECTGSRPITEVKQCWACPVLGWVTAWEQQVL